MRERQNSTARGIGSICWKMEAPVVVKPDTDSNSASTGLMVVPANMNGSAPTMPASTQEPVTTSKPSR